MVRFGAVSSFGYRLFTDRELARGATFFDAPSGLGAETTGVGARLPGALLGLLFALPQQLTTDPHAVWRLQLTLATVGAVALSLAARPTFAAAPALLAGYLCLCQYGVHDTVSVLWNPGFLVLPAVIATVGLLRAVAAQRTDGLDLLVCGAALGLQVHASALALGLAALPAVLWLGPPGALRRLPRALGLGALLLLPYLLDEARSGGQNTALWLQQADATARGWRVAPVWSHAAFLAGLPELARPGGAPAWPHLLDRAALLLGVALAIAAAPAARRRVYLALALTIGLYLLSLGQNKTPEPVPRYVTALGPAFALLLAAPWVELAARRRPYVAALWLALLLPFASPGLDYLRPTPAAWTSWRAADRRLAEVRSRLDWTLEQQVRRTVWAWSSPSGALSYGLGPGMAAPLHHEGASFLGSAPGPCALLLVPMRPGPTRGPSGAAALAEVVPDATLLDAQPLDAGGELLVFDPGPRRCPTTLIQRYVDLPVEAQLRALQPPPACLHAAPIDGPPGLTRLAVRLPADARDLSCKGQPGFLLAVDLQPHGGSLTATLHSAQLRGFGDNSGWLGSFGIEQPRLAFRDATGETSELTFEPGPVGGMGAATPLSATVPLAGGPWQVELRLDLPEAQPTELGGRSAAPRQPLAVRLLDAYTP